MSSLDLEQRVANLERANRRWKWTAAVLISIVVTAAAKPSDEVAPLIQTRRLEILDDDDKPIVTLGVMMPEYSTSIGLAILSGKKPVMMLSNGLNGGTISLDDRDEDEPSSVSLDTRNLNFRRFDRGTKDLVEIQATKNGGELSVYDKTGRLAVTLGADKDDRGYITIHDADGKVRKRLVGE